MRDASIAVLREIGVETGGSNVQFGVNPDTGRVVVIEMNPRGVAFIGIGVQSKPVSRFRQSLPSQPSATHWTS